MDNDDYAELVGVDAQAQVVKMDEQKPIHDTECTHETLIPEPDDTIGDATYYGCANIRCGRGWYLRPNEEKNIT